MTTTKSTQTGLLAALAAFQAEAPTLPKDKVNPHFHSKFTGLDTVVETIRPLLAQHGLVWMTKPGQDDRGPTLLYKLAHVPSGEVESGTMPLLLGKQDMQGLGGALTYARRYAICAVLNLVADDDDDGNTASQPAQAAPGRTQNGVTASAAQIKNLQGLIKRKHVSRPQLEVLLQAVGADGVTVEEGWTSKLTGGRQGTASALIDRLTKGLLPDVDHPSDVPPPAEGEFIETTPVGADQIPFEERV